MYVLEGRRILSLRGWFPYNGEETLQNVVREAEKGYIWGGSCSSGSSTIIRLSSKSIGRRKDRRI